MNREIRRKLVLLWLSLVAVFTFACTAPRQPPSRAEAAKTQTTRPASLSGPGQGAKLGLYGLDAKWSENGAYLQKLIDTVQVQWEQLILKFPAPALPAAGTQVAVKFVLDSQGNIASVISVDGTANETAKRACVSAITERAPYGAWPAAMKATLGDKQEMTFNFYYR